jgi:phosphate starvation-inducible protein PhoH and related proteins
LTGTRAGSGGQATGTNTVVRTKITLQFDDNRLVALLLGGHDAHLALIEQRLGIEGVANGNVVTITGPLDACEQAEAVLKALYERVRKGEIIANGDVDGVIRHTLAAPLKETQTKDGQPRDSMATIRTRKKVITARTLMQSEYIRALDRTDLVFGIGPAGTGKTYIAVAFAAQCLERNLVERIILSRPAVEAGERLGFLPGDMKEKVDPYLRPLYDALYDVLPPEKVERDMLSGIIEIAPLAFMRGRTLANACVILDEAQNTTTMQMKMFLTRLGEGSKMIVNGDPTQIDLPLGQTSGLEDAVNVLTDVKGIDTVRFTAKDVVRRDLVGKIVEAYEKAPPIQQKAAGRR